MYTLHKPTLNTACESFCTVKTSILHRRVPVIDYRSDIVLAKQGKSVNLTLYMSHCFLLSFHFRPTIDFQCSHSHYDCPFTSTWEFIFHALIRALIRSEARFRTLQLEFSTHHNHIRYCSRLPHCKRSLDALRLLQMSSRAPAHTDDGSTTSFESLSQAVHQQIQYYDAQKNALIEGVLQRYAFEAQQMAHERQSIRVEREALRKAKQEADVYKNDLSVLQSLTNRDAFALVLIDGNGILFRDQYLQDSSEGGQRAAKDIQAEVLSHLISHVAETPPDVKVVVRIYADFCHLNVMYRQARSSNGHDMLRAITEFAAAFTEGSALCDFIHVKRRGGCISAKIAGKCFGILRPREHSKSPC